MLHGRGTKVQGKGGGERKEKETTTVSLGTTELLGLMIFSVNVSILHVSSK